MKTKKLTILMTTTILGFCINNFVITPKNINAEEIGHKYNNLSKNINSKDNFKNSKKKQVIYQVKYIDDSTGKELTSYPVKNFDFANNIITEKAKNFKGYTLISDKTFTIKLSEENNDCITFHYLPNNYDTSYVYKNEKKQDMKTLWVKGIVPPKMGENGDFTKDIVSTKEYYVTSQNKGNGWFDVNKATGNLDINDFALCGGATAANMLHWWLDQNKEYVNRFIKENPKNGVLEFNREKKADIRDLINSYNKDDHSSKIFNLFKQYFARLRKGIWADTTIDMFINGYKPSLYGLRNHKEQFNNSKDPRGGFFREVFKDEILTERDNINSYEDLNRLVKQRLKEGRVLAISHLMTSKIGHIVTVWGADFDSNGNLKGLYLSDSDDYDSTFKDKNNNKFKYSMKRYNVENKNNILKLSTEKEEGFGVKVLDLYSLSLGQDAWNNYFKKH